MTATHGQAGPPEGDRPPAVGSDDEPDQCWATRLGQREEHDLRRCSHYPPEPAPAVDGLDDCPHGYIARTCRACTEPPEPPQQWVRLVHWITGLSMDLGCDAANVPGSRASSDIAEVSCAACHAAYRDEATIAAELRRLFGGVL